MRLRQAADRFLRDLAAALGRTPARDERIALAVSGGRDSMAMLALAHAALDGGIVVATVDHRLRAAAADEAALVAAWCRDHGILHCTLTPDQPPAGASLQAQARHMRYALLGRFAVEQGIGVLLTAHHADDQAETFLMRAARGSGPGGLAGIRTRWTWQHRRWHGEPPEGSGAEPTVAVVRPLLGWTRGELAAVASAAAMPVACDPSNADLRHDRTRVRALLATTDLLDARAVARSAALCADAEQVLEETVDWLLGTRCDRDGAGYVLDVAALPRTLRRRMVQRAIGDLRREGGITEGPWSDTTAIEPLLDALEEGGQATQAGILASAEGTRWHLRPAPVRRTGRTVA